MNDCSHAAIEEICKKKIMRSTKKWIAASEFRLSDFIPAM